MAHITTTVTVQPRIFGFSGLPDNVQERSMVPRGEVVFSELNFDILLSGVGDSQQIDIFTILPINFAYVLAETSIRLFGVNASNWDDVGLGFIQDDNVAATRKIRIPIEWFSRGESGDGVAPARHKVYTTQNIPNMLMVPSGSASEGVSMKFQTSNLTLNQSSMKGDFFARFLMYDVSQAHNYQVNTPTLIR